jgi:hypothetical protein
MQTIWEKEGKVAFHLNDDIGENNDPDKGYF